MERSQPEDAGQSPELSAELAAVSEVLRGNTQAFRLIVERYKNLLYKLSFSFLGNREDAEESTQDILMRAFRYLHRFSLERRFLPWLYTIAINHLRAVYARSRRREARQQSLESGPEAGRVSDPQEIFERVQQRKDVRKAVLSLPRRLREPMILHYFEELGVATIAEILRISEVNVKSRLLRARREVKKKMEEGATPSAEVRYTYLLEGRADGTGDV